jgi:hypothetical protein
MPLSKEPFLWTDNTSCTGSTLSAARTAYGYYGILRHLYG